jgi:hypothetical protein
MARSTLVFGVALLAMALAGCSPAAPPTATAAPAAQVEPPSPIDLQKLAEGHDWASAPGEKLTRDWAAGVRAALGKLARPDAIAAIEAAGFACIYGEAHADYPDPMAVCSRSFATRACQMYWEIASTAENGGVASVDGDFKRDCVGTADDWPVPVKSAIDDQVAPGLPPE